MAKHRWSVLCRRGIVDKYTNLLSVFEVVDELTTEGDPPEVPLPPHVGVTVESQLVSMWDRSEREKPEAFWQTVILTGPDGQSEGSGVKIEGKLLDHPRVRLLLTIKAIRFYGAGTYNFNIYYSKTGKVKGKLVSQVPLEIKVKESPISPTEPEQPPGQS